MPGNVLFLDLFGGAAGDMLVATLLACGVRLEALQAELSKVDLRGYRLRTERVQRGAFAAVRFVVESDGSAPATAVEHRGHDHGHDHGHSHDHGHDHGHVAAALGLVSAPALDPTGGFPGQPWRTWRQIRALIQQAGLAPRVTERALLAFGLLAEAEARVHGMDVEEVNFHEVGAVDSIVDIVAFCIGLELLDVEVVVASPPPMGSGQVYTAHGWIPIPAPATLECLRGWPVRPGLAGMEQVTPTGAALVAALARPGALPAMTVTTMGYGGGTRNPPELANVIRGVLGRPAIDESAREIEVIEAQMDDLVGEDLPSLIDALLDAGAVDAFATPVLMKKGRPGLLVTALATAATVSAVERAFLAAGSSFGLRRAPARRRVLDRWFERVETPIGSARVKIGAEAGERLQAKPEFEDLRALAAESGRTVREVRAMVMAAYASTQPGGPRGV
jgi:uncharacterized protein (TIGR00299 family) protein